MTQSWQDRMPQLVERIIPPCQKQTVIVREAEIQYACLKAALQATRDESTESKAAVGLSGKDIDKALRQHEKDRGYITEEMAECAKSWVPRVKAVWREKWPHLELLSDESTTAGEPS